MRCHTIMERTVRLRLPRPPTGCAAAAMVLTLLAYLLFPSDSSAQGLSDQFKRYWYAGKAEVSRFVLKQDRYGHTHEGDAILIYVTEDFLTDRQVKDESGSSSASVPVMKLNFIRTFTTGLYEYSLMTSVFKPLDTANHPRALKLTSTRQDWCGNSFRQLNLTDGRYRVQTRSYFERVGDRDGIVEAVPTEDALWIAMRLDPESLPQGEVRLIPSLQASALHHVPLRPYRAHATLETIAADVGGTRFRYTIRYTEIDRVLTIDFEKEFPHAVLSWEERNGSGQGSPPAKTTRAVRTHLLHTDYWNLNSPGDRHLRRALGLEP